MTPKENKFPTGQAMQNLKINDFKEKLTTKEIILNFNM